MRKFSIFYIHAIQTWPYIKILTFECIFCEGTLINSDQYCGHFDIHAVKSIIARFQKNLPGFLVMGGNSIQNNKTHFRAYCKTRLVRLYGVDTTINARVQRF